MVNGRIVLLHQNINAKNLFNSALADPVENHYASACEEGILLRGEKEPTKPAKLEVLDDYNVNLTISEGRYHQVKRMFAALGDEVVALHRWRIGNVELDESLEEGEFQSTHSGRNRQFSEII